MYYYVGNKRLFDTDKIKWCSVEDSLEYLNKLDEIGLDTETTGFDCHSKKLTTLQLGDSHNQFVIDVGCVDINKYYKSLIESKIIIGHNLKFDIRFLFNHSIIPIHVHDTMIVEQLLYLGYPPNGKPGGISYSLAAVANRYLNIYIDKSIRGEINWRGLTDDVIIYAANDVRWLHEIKYKQIEACKNKNCVSAVDVENHFVPVIAYLEWCGIKLDVSKWEEKMKVDQANLVKSKNILDSLAISWGNTKFYSQNLQGDLFAGFNTNSVCTINWSSANQVIEVAKYLGFNTQIQDKKTGEDKESVVEKHLKPQKGINDEFLNAYFNYQEASKVCSTYGSSYIDAVHPNTGRIHTVFKQLGAASGRMSCGAKEPNKDLAQLKGIPASRCKYVQLQNLPADHHTRASFIPETGNLMVACDYSALEARLGADIYNETTMIEEFIHGSGDMHSLIAKACFPKELANIAVKDIKNLRPDLRKRAKPVGFSQQFGGSAYAIQSSLGCSLKVAEEIATGYNNGFVGISKFKEEGAAFVKKYGYVLICKLTGHKLYWHNHKEWKSMQESFTNSFWDKYRIMKEINPNSPEVLKVRYHFKVGSKWERMALNAPTQGSGIICLKYGMYLFFKWIIENNLFGKVLICNLIHDEAVCEYPENISEPPNKLQECMEKSASVICKKLPIPAVPEVGHYWIH